MIRRLPRSTLFPTRRSSDLKRWTDKRKKEIIESRTKSIQLIYELIKNTTNKVSTVISAARSEEHTSELQSRQYLVCRLLLEKKKTNDMLNKTNLPIKMYKFG